MKLRKERKMSPSMIYKYHLQPHLNPNTRILIIMLIWMMSNLMKATKLSYPYKMPELELSQPKIEKVALINKMYHAMLKLKLKTKTNSHLSQIKHRNLNSKRIEGTIMIVTMMGMLTKISQIVLVGNVTILNIFMMMMERLQHLVPTYVNN